MQYANYAAFRNALLSLLDGSDTSQADISIPVLDLIIASGEQRIYRDLRSTTQDAALSIVATSNVATLPADFLELRNLYVPGYVSAVYAPYEAIQSLIQTGASTANGPVYYTTQGDTLIFYPSVTGVTISGRYFKRFNDIATGLNALITRHPDVFLYAALAESAPFLGENDRLQIWEAKYNQLVNAANEQERRRMTRGSKLATRLG